MKDDALDAEALISELQRLRGVACAGCGRKLSHFEVLISISLGFGRAPRCLSCLSAGLECAPGRLRESAFRLIEQRECYWASWNWACRDLGLPEGTVPSQLPELN